MIIPSGNSSDASSLGAHVYYTARLVGALLLATLVPFLIDRRARRPSSADR